MNHFFKISCVFLLLPFSVSGQNYIFSGKVLDHNNAPIDFANVILLNKDSVTVKGEYTDETGRYHIEDVAPQMYLLKINALGYQAHLSEVMVQEDVLDWVVYLEEEILQEVVVTAKKPIIERRANGLVFNVENSTLSEGTVWNTLTKTPYLIETGGAITVKGQSPLVYINNRRVYLSSNELKQLLESTPANLIKSVEVLLNPPASYDADGAAVINIQMTKNMSTGYNGTMGGIYTQGVYPKYQFNTSHFYKMDKLNTFFSYAHQNRKTYYYYNENTRFFTDDVPSGDWFTETTRVMRTRRHNFMTNVDYTVNDKHALNLSAMVSFVPYEKYRTPSDVEAYNLMTEQIDSSFHSLTQSSEDRSNVALSLDYVYTIGKGKKLTANVHHTGYNYDYEQFIRADYYGSDGSPIRTNAFDTYKDQSVKIYTAQSDFSASGDKYGSFKTGAKWTHIEFDNDLEQVNVVGINPDISDIFFYKETNVAGYVTHSKSWDHWETSLGVRGEHSLIEGESVLEGVVNSQNYFKLFPSASITYKPSENHEYTLSYSKRIKRPQFNKLNPFRIFLNDNSYTAGNPNLKPTLTHEVNLSYTLQNTYTFSLYYRRRLDDVWQLPFIDNDNNQIVFVEDNVEKNIGYGLDILVNKNLFSWWNAYAYISIFREEDVYSPSLDSEDRLSDLGLWGVYYQVNNSFTLSKDGTFTGDIGYQHMPDIPYGNYIADSWSNLSLSLRKSLWKNRATFSVGVTDLFLQTPSAATVKYADQSIRWYTNPESRTFEVRFTYKVGNYKLRVSRKDIRKEEIDRLN